MKKILVIEDAKTIAKVLELMLLESGYQPILAFDAAQAVMFAQREKPDLIILDIMLPAGGGYEVAKKLRILTNTQLIPIVVFSAADLDEVRENTAMYNIQFFVEKPDTAQLLKLIDEILGEGQ